MARTPVYVEIGRKRVFAGSVDWPGWTRSGRDEDAAIETLLAYAPRYAKVLRGTGLKFDPPWRPSTLPVVERLSGNATTEFGAPDIPTSSDTKPIATKDLERFQTILKASWRALDRAADAAEDKELTKGPRGGGRDLDKIVDHILGSDESYLSRLGARAPKSPPRERAARLRAAILDTLERVARDGVPEGPRGGKRWTPRYFVRRSAWHVLDHAWEIEDRTPG
ncbi:MAG TPA: hypothetical protein VFA08_05750 [Actinomycetota bacterium]|nr:hypothetical protein [Actinomycetota bacterium]